MRQGITREEIVSTIKQLMITLLEEHDKLNNVANNLFTNHNIPSSTVYSLTDDNVDFKDVDIIELGLILKYIGLELNQKQDYIKTFFTDVEVQKMNIYKRTLESDILSLEFKPALRLKDDLYYIYMTWEMLAKVYEKGKFIWDERVQRESIEKKYGDTIHVVPKVNRTNVKEIKQQCLDGILMENELAFNVVKYSSSEGREIYYDEKTLTLIISQDALGHILDGFHRTMGIYEAWLENPNVKGVMPIRLSNYDIDDSARYQYELSKATPVDKAKIQFLDKSRITDEIVDKLMLQGRLQGKIDKKTKPNRDAGRIVSYKVLSDAFYDNFGDDKNPKILDITKKFKEYLNYLFELYGDEYLNSKSVLLFRNPLFTIHVNLFSYLYKNNIDMGEVDNIINLNYFEYKYVKNSKIKELTNTLIKEYEERREGLE